MSLEITGIHGGVINLDSLSAKHIVNRIKKGVELLKSDETDYIVMLGYIGRDMKKYALKKWDISERRIFADRDGMYTLEEIVSFKNRFIAPNGYKIIGSISQDWHMNRIKMIYERVLPRYSVSYFEVEDDRSKGEIKIDTDKEKIVTQLDKYRLKLPSYGVLPNQLQNIVRLGVDFYFLVRKS